ncbi:MAG: NAD-dependent epimerase/dehydratase family protein, partial [Leptolyngbyaceae cyanobacterium]
MKILVTGSSGFLGRYVVAAALQRGHEVRAVQRDRPGRSPLPWEASSAVETFAADLLNPQLDPSMLSGIDSVIHLAASKSGDFETAYQGTVQTTQNLLKVVAAHLIKKLVLISSFSVYDYRQISPGTVLSENAPMSEDLSERDAYAQTKLAQEQLVRQHAAQHGYQISVIRPGMIFGRGALWNASHGHRAGPAWLLIGGRHVMPLTYVENCATAIVLAATAATLPGEVFNIVDDDLPTRREYTQAISEQAVDKPSIMPVSQPLLRGMASVASTINRTLLQNKVN